MMGISKKLETIYHNGQPDGIRSMRRSPFDDDDLCDSTAVAGGGERHLWHQTSGHLLYLKEDEGNNIAQDYIGPDAQRISSGWTIHNRSKDFWNKAIMFLAERPDVYFGYDKRS